MKEQVLRSPFVDKKFLDLANEVIDPIEVKIENDDYLIVPQSAILILIRDDLEELAK